MSWIHIDDLTQLYCFAIQNNNFNGIYNAVAENVSNKVFSKFLSKVLGKSFWLPNVPRFVLKLVLGEMAVLLLEGSAISNQKLKKTDFKLKFDNIEGALKNLV
jgi:hypothetical protein